MKSASFKVIENEWISLADGRRLSARIWIPKNAKKEPVPAFESDQQINQRHWGKTIKRDLI